MPSTRKHGHPQKTSISRTAEAWLREESIGARLIDLLLRAAFVFLLVAVFAAIIGINEARAARQYGGPVYRWLLPNSMQAATLDECQKARPDLGRPHATSSQQSRSGEPWHHRFCWFRV